MTERSYSLDTRTPKTIGRMGAFHGNFGALVRAYAYMSTLGMEGIANISRDAVINANYILSRLKGYYDLPYDRSCMHEVVFSARSLRREQGVSALGCGKASHRLRYPPADDVLPPYRRRGAHD